MINFSILIKGKVQGVFFRASAQQEANRLGLTGYVRNQADGSVYAEVEGQEEIVEEFIHWCFTGPPNARVTDVYSEKGLLKNFKTFDIRHSD